MTLQTTLYKRVALDLERHRVETWLFHLDRLDLRRIEAASDGNSIHHGGSTCLSLALWWRERLVTLSFLIMPHRIQDVSERVASAIENLSMVSSQGDPTQSAPKWLEGVWNGWDGDWNSLADRWRPELDRSISSSGTQQLALSLERRELLLRDHDGRTRQVTRYATRLLISSRRGPKGRGTWTMTVPFDTPEPRDLVAHVKRARRHAQLRACRTPTDSGTGPILLQPTALAQILATVRSSREPGDCARADFLPAGVVHAPAAYKDDLGFPVKPRATNAIEVRMRFEHQAALPTPGLDQLWIETGKLPSRKGRPSGLTIWHFDELLSRSLQKQFVTIASGEVVTSDGCRDVSRLRLDIPWCAVQRALLDPSRRGRSALAIQFGETAYFLPSLSLGEFSWAPL